MYKSTETPLKCLHISGNNIIYFDSFEVEHIPVGTKRFIGKENIVTNFWSGSLQLFPVV